MRNHPVLIDAVTTESAAEMVVNAASRHFLQREQGMFSQARFTLGEIQTKFQFRRMRELGRSAKATLGLFEGPDQVGNCRGDRTGIEFAA